MRRREIRAGCIGEAVSGVSSMFLMYVDESGDSGIAGSPTRYFVLTGLVVHELRWQTYLEQLIDFRQRMKRRFGLRLREELHATRLITRPGSLVRIKRNDRLTIMRAMADELASMSDLNIINVLVDKQGKQADYDVFENAWKTLIQRFENTMSLRNFSGPANPDERGMIFPDRTDDKKLTRLLRQMRRYNLIPNQPRFGSGYRDLALRSIVEDPNFRDSEFSYFIQAADIAAYLLYQRMAPNAYMRKKSGQNYFKRLDPVLCTVASSTDPDGIV
ncbi:MAG: DUF3800 domain-containing protein, partial [Rubrobacteraceae bacterium]